jgi:tRNA nucleotidyltransferase (CCA-adding enzyme)
VNSVAVRALIETNLSQAQRGLLDRISRIAEAQRLPVYLVGGVVRDLLLGLAPGDLDFVVDGDATALARAAARALGGEVLVHAPFGTAAWMRPEGEAIDFAAARTETYAEPAALPTVTAPAPIADDLRRRDFTINAIALRLDGEHFGELLDPHGGQTDLAARVVRVVHPRSFIDDPTRMFRAVRYEQRLGFAIAPETLALIPGAWDALAALTGDRLRREFELIFREPRAVQMLARLDELAILRRVHPALRWGATESSRAEAAATLPRAEWRLPFDDWGRPLSPEPDALFLALMLGAAAPAEVAQALARLNANRAVSRAVEEALTLRPGWSRPSGAVAALDGLSELGVIAAYVAHEAARPTLHDYLARWRFVRARTTGDDLIALGLTPGPQFKQILWRLRAARLDGEVSDAAGEQRLLRQLLAEMKKPDD